METLVSLRPTLQKGLASARCWLQGMVDASTDRLYYEYMPVARRRVHKPSPVRDLGTASDLAALQAFAGGREFDAAIGATLDHYRAMLVHERSPEAEGGVASAEGLGATETEPELADGPLPWCFLDSVRLGEPSSIAHNAFFALGLAAWESYPREGEKEALLSALANGIVHQQQANGTYKVYFEPPGLHDSGWQLYGGEAMLGVLAAYQRLGDERLWGSVSAALPAYQALWKAGRVDEDELVFFANWQAQAGKALAMQATDRQQKGAVTAYLHALQDDIQRRGFYGAVGKAPEHMAVVEVACGLEALADTLALALEEGNDKRAARYAAQVQALVAFLDRAQVKEGEGVPAEAVGGWCHTVGLNTQRIDVTGHVVCAYIKLLNLMGEE